MHISSKSQDFTSQFYIEKKPDCRSVRSSRRRFAKFDPNVAINRDLKVGTLKVYQALAMARNYNTGECWASVFGLSQMAGISERTVKTAISELCKVGAISNGIRRRKMNGRMETLREISLDGPFSMAIYENSSHSFGAEYRTLSIAMAAKGGALYIRQSDLARMMGRSTRTVKRHLQKLRTSDQIAIGRAGRRIHAKVYGMELSTGIDFSKKMSSR